jgi:hypothetical protein
MRKNVGTADRVIWFFIAAGLAVTGLLNLNTGFWWVGVLAIVPLVTGLAGYCPIWHLTGIKTVFVKKL